MSQQKLKCQEANHICDKNQYKEAKFWDRVKLAIHLIYCRACQKYSARNSKLTKAVKDPSVTCLPDQDKQVIKKHLQEELSK